MSEPIHLFNIKMLDAVSIGTSQTSVAVNLEETVSYAVQAVWSAGTSPVGDLYLEASNDGSNFTQIEESLLPVTGNSGSIMINVEKPAYSYVRVVYSRTSGTATLTAIINGKRG